MPQHSTLAYYPKQLQTPAKTSLFCSSHHPKPSLHKPYSQNSQQQHSQTAHDLKTYSSLKTQLKFVYESIMVGSGPTSIRPSNLSSQAHFYFALHFILQLGAKKTISQPNMCVQTHNRRVLYKQSYFFYQQHLLLLLSLQKQGKGKMSEPIYCQNKALAVFTLNPEQNIQKDSLLEPNSYTGFIHHYHYPVVYFEDLYQHYKNCLPSKIKAGNFRLSYKGAVIPSQLPIGLSIQWNHQELHEFVICVEDYCLPDGFRVIKNSWKKAYEVINSNRRCDYVKTRLSEEQLKKKYQLYKTGKSHNLHNEGLYEGTNVMVKAIVRGEVIERKFTVEQFPTVESVSREMFPLPEIWENKPQIFSHAQPIDLTMPTHTFLDHWNYNDGFCYLELKI